MKSKLKKSLSLLLALVMCLSVMSVGVFAEGETYTVTFELIDDVGSILVPGVTSGTIDTDYTKAASIVLKIYDGTGRNVVPYFTQTVNSGGVAKRPSAAAYYDYNVLQIIAGTGADNKFTNEDSGAYTFDGWATEDGKLYDFTNPVTANLTLHPRFSATGATITINDSYTLYDFAREVELGRKFNSNYAQGAGTPQTVQLSDNVTLTGNWEPIVQSFWGTFDGNGKTISGLSVNSTSKKAGFFSELGYQVTVKNLTFASPSVVTTDEQAGTLAGLVNAATITNVTVTNPTVSGKNNVGGLVGSVSAGAKFETCSVSGNGTIEATENASGPSGRPVGGLIGDTTGEVTLNGCSVSGVTISGARKLGGLIGQVNTNADNAIFSCTNVSVDNVTINSIATTSFTKELTMGGLIGEFAAIQGTHTFSGTVSNITMTGPENIAEGKNYIMGLVSGGTSAAVAEAKTAVQNANMTFNVTVSGTNTRTIETESDYEGIMGTAVATPVVDYYGKITELGASYSDAMTLKFFVTLTKEVNNPQFTVTRDADNKPLTLVTSENAFLVAKESVYLVTNQGNGSYKIEVKLFAKWLSSPVTLRMFDGNTTGDALKLHGYNYSAAEVTREDGTDMSYSMLDYLKIMKTYQSSDTRFSSMYDAIKAYGEAGALWRSSL